VPTSDTTSLTQYPARYFAAWNGHRLDGVDGLLAPVFSWTDPCTDVFTVDGDGRATAIRAHYGSRGRR
jgi:hypothetical protein